MTRRAERRFLLDTSAVIYQLHGHTLQKAAVASATAGGTIEVPVFVRMEYLRGVIFNLIDIAQPDQGERHRRGCPHRLVATGPPGAEAQGGDVDGGEELRNLAAHRLAQEKPGQTLQATELVHEAYLRLVDVEKAQHLLKRMPRRRS
jgi:hypothetical protein